MKYAGGWGGTKRLSSLSGRGSAHLSWLRPCLCARHTMTARSPRSPLHLPPARPMHCSAFFRQSLHQQGCGPVPAGLPRHIIFAFFFTLISIQRLCWAAPELVWAVSPTCQCCQWDHPAVKTERRGPPLSLLSSRLLGLLAGPTGLQSPDLICSVHPGDIFINSEFPAGFVSLAPQFNKLGFYCV